MAPGRLLPAPSALRRRLIFHPKWGIHRPSGRPFPAAAHTLAMLSAAQRQVPDSEWDRENGLASREFTHTLFVGSMPMFLRRTFLQAEQPAISNRNAHQSHAVEGLLCGNGASFLSADQHAPTHQNSADVQPQPFCSTPFVHPIPCGKLNSTWPPTGQTTASAPFHEPSGRGSASLGTCVPSSPRQNCQVH